MKVCRRSGKHIHKSRGAAEAHIRSLVKIEPDIQWNAYLCVYCRGWHVGRSRKGAHRNKYASQ